MTPERAAAMASQHGTPFYFYDLAVLRDRARRARAALPARLLYAVKANPHPQVLRALRGEVHGADVASGGELELALSCGFEPGELSFAGPGKTPEALARAVSLGVLINVESLRELRAVAALRPVARVRLRLNPLTRVHAYRLSMMGAPSPFGIDEEELPAAAQCLRELSTRVAFEGLHVHAGAQCTSVGGFAVAVGAALDLAQRLHLEHGLAVKQLNFGGGFGFLGPGEALDVEAAGRRLGALLEQHRAATGQQVEAVLEPGRWLAAPAGVYVARVLGEKVSRGTHFTILDGGMNHHLAATGHLGPSKLPIVNLSRPDAPLVRRTLVGPLCTPLDTFGEVELAEPAAGDLIGVLGSGAYGYSFSPLHFLSHRLPKEIVDG